MHRIKHTQTQTPTHPYNNTRLAVYARLRSLQANHSDPSSEPQHLPGCTVFQRHDDTHHDELIVLIPHGLFAPPKKHMRYFVFDLMRVGMRMHVSATVLRQECIDFCAVEFALGLLLFTLSRVRGYLLFVDRITLIYIINIMNNRSKCQSHTSI